MDLFFYDLFDISFGNVLLTMFVFFLWVLIMGMAGGFVLALSSPEKEYRNAMILIGTGMPILIIYMSNVIPILVFWSIGLLGVIAGCEWGMYHKKKRKKRSEIR